MSLNREYPILEFDEAREALVEPSKYIKSIDGMPRKCLITFFDEVVNHLVATGKAKEIHSARTAMGKHPIYRYEFEDQAFALFHPGVGAPLAAGLFEDMIAYGCDSFMVCGGAGVLDKDLAVGHLVVPISAVRDEGTSYHYLPPGREVAPSDNVVATIKELLDKKGIKYKTAKTWTTDAFYRETPGKVERRKAEGCLTVEMEAAALFAVAKFRGVQIGQILYSGDNLDGEHWEHRDWIDRKSIRRELVEVAAEVLAALP